MRCCIPVAIVVLTSGCVRLLESSASSRTLPAVEGGAGGNSDRAGAASDAISRAADTLVGDGISKTDGSPRTDVPLKKDAAPRVEAGAAVGCASWANYGCSGTISSCTATCAGPLGANILLTCNVAMSVTCTCKINAVQLPTCTGIPYQGNCAACQAAVEAGCCQFH